MIFIFTIVNFEKKHGGIKINVVRDRDSGTLNNGHGCPLFSLPPPPPAPGNCVINILHNNSFEEYLAFMTRFAFEFISCYSSWLTILCALRFSRKVFYKKNFCGSPPRRRIDLCLMFEERLEISLGTQFNRSC